MYENYGAINLPNMIKQIKFFNNSVIYYLYKEIYEYNKINEKSL